MSRVCQWLSACGRFAGERLEPARIRFICLAIVGLSVAMLVLSFATRTENQTIFGTPLGADFAGFYYAGQILNDGQPHLLYDRNHQSARFHALLPRLQPGEELPYVHPPFVAFAFRPLALLPLSVAFAVWLLVSASLYVAGCWLLWQVGTGFQAGDRTTALVLLLAFEPFVMECWLGGQLSAVAFFLFALAFHLEMRGRAMLSGLALGLCLYKPTLLVLFLPMLGVGRRGWTFAGAALGGTFLAGVAILAVGWDESLHYLQVLRGFSEETAGSLKLRDWKYVDLNTFFRLLLGGTSIWQRAVLVATCAGPLAYLARLWWTFGREGEAVRRLTWAATLTGTCVLNVYFGVYDTVVAAAAALITADVLRAARPGTPFPAVFKWLMVLLFVVPWVTQPLARCTHVQTYTLVLCALLVFEMRSAAVLCRGAA